MIKNEIHYRNRQKTLEKFREALKDLESQRNKMEPVRYQLDYDSNKNMIEEVEEELREYEKLKTGEKKILSCHSLNELPLLLIKARIANNLTHDKLAEKVDIHAQQIQKYEANDFNEVKWERLVEIAYALGIGDNFSAVVNLNVDKLHGQEPSGRFDLGEVTDTVYKAQQKVSKQKSLFY